MHVFQKSLSVVAQSFAICYEMHTIYTLSSLTQYTVFNAKCFWC